jgi:hypothetical protein
MSIQLFFSTRIIIRIYIRQLHVIGFEKFLAKEQKFFKMQVFNWIQNIRISVRRYTSRFSNLCDSIMENKTGYLPLSKVLVLLNVREDKNKYYFFRFLTFSRGIS